MKPLAEKLLNAIKAVFRQLKDKTNIVIFLIVFLVLSCEIWAPYILAIITGNELFWAVGSACWAFWALPFTPFLPICFAITFGIRKLLDHIRIRKKSAKENQIEKQEDFTKN